MNYENDVRIDETALDVEWLNQAELAIKYGQYYSECHTAVVRAEERIKIIKAELIIKANSNPARYCKKEKPTVGDIESFCITHPRHIDAKEQWMEALQKESDAAIIKNEISFTRKAALEGLVQLYISQYFAGPSMPRDLIAERQAFQERQKKVNIGIAKKLKGRRRRS